MTPEVSAADPAVTFRTPRTPEGMRGAILLSILGPTAWLAFTLLYVGFWATGFTLFQSIVVVLVSVVALGGVLGASWAWYSLRRPKAAAAP